MIEVWCVCFTLNIKKPNMIEEWRKRKIINWKYWIEKLKQKRNKIVEKLKLSSVEKLNKFIEFN